MSYDLTQRHFVVDHVVGHFGQTHGTHGPGAVDGELLVNDIPAHIERGLTSFSDKTGPAVYPGAPYHVDAGLRDTGAIEGSICPFAMG